MRSLMMTSAAIVLSIGLVACSSQSKETLPAVVEEAPVQTTATTASSATQTQAPTTAAVSQSNMSAVATPVGPKAGSSADFQVNVGDRVYFDLDQYRLSSDAQNVLKRQAAWLASYPGVNILVAGNCDERGTREYNLALGERRASVVKDYLVSLGVDSARVQTVSYGKERPLAIGTNEAAWAQNRNGFTQLISGVSG